MVCMFVKILLGIYFLYNRADNVSQKTYFAKVLISIYSAYNFLIFTNHAFLIFFAQSLFLDLQLSLAKASTAAS